MFLRAAAKLIECQGISCVIYFKEDKMNKVKSLVLGCYVLFSVGTSGLAFADKVKEDSDVASAVSHFCSELRHGTEIKTASGCFGSGEQIFLIPKKYAPICRDAEDGIFKRIAGENTAVKFTVAVAKFLQNDLNVSDGNIRITIPDITKEIQATGCKGVDTKSLLKKILKKKADGILIYDQEAAFQGGKKAIIGIKDRATARHSYSVFYKTKSESYDISYAVFCYTVNGHCVGKELSNAQRSYVYEISFPISYSDRVFEIVENSINFIEKLKSTTLSEGGMK